MFHSIKKRSAQEHTAAEKKYVAKATRRRRRILVAGFFLFKILDISTHMWLYKYIQVLNIRQV